MGGGFTLLEVLVAMTVLSVGIVGVLAAMSLSVRASGQAWRVDEVSRLAQNQLALAANLSVDQLEPSNGVLERYKWLVSYAEKPHGLVVACVTVEWMEEGQARTYRLCQVFRPRAAEGSK
jgi:prepilin-type N-terminal cleavage/methylation domain-containing protein